LIICEGYDNFQASPWSSPFTGLWISLTYGGYIAHAVDIGMCVLNPRTRRGCTESAECVRVDFPPVIDGWVNDVQWQKAPSILDFTQFDPEEEPRRPKSRLSDSCTTIVRCMSV